MDDLDLLGAAEKHVAEELRDGIAKLRENAQQLVDEIDKIDLDRIEATLLDGKKREALIGMIKPLQSSVGSLAITRLMPVLVGAMCKPDEAETT